MNIIDQTEDMLIQDGMKEENASHGMRPFELSDTWI